jgi:hypothetical protein
MLKRIAGALASVIPLDADEAVVRRYAQALGWPKREQREVLRGWRSMAKDQRDEAVARMRDHLFEAKLFRDRLDALPCACSHRVDRHDAKGGCMDCGCVGGLSVP